MYASIVFALATTAAMAAPLAQRDAVPEGWAVGYLENYETYHTRYLALQCYNKHDTEFFDECCHPLLATENLSDHRLDICIPNATVSASGSVAPSATASAEAEAASEYVSAAGTGADATSAVADAQAQIAQATSSTSTWVAPSTTSTQEAAATSEASNSGSYDKTGGYATYFYQNGNAGACGTVHADSDKVIAIDASGYWSDYASNNNSPYCGKWINIKNTNNGKTVTAMVADVCPTCTTDNSLDLSVGAFTAIASESDGMVPIEWSWA